MPTTNNIEKKENTNEKHEKPNKKKDTKKMKKKYKKVETNNFVRILSNYFSNLPFLKNFNLLHFIKGNYYLSVHSFLICIILFITLFNTSIVHLSVLLIVVSMDALSVVVLHGCPLTLMEKKYLGLSGMDFHNIFLKNMKISYDCNHIYEQQVELLTNVWCIIACKILIIIFLKTLNLELINFNCLYSNSLLQK